MKIPNRIHSILLKCPELGIQGNFIFYPDCLVSTRSISSRGHWWTMRGVAYIDGNLPIYVDSWETPVELITKDTCWREVNWQLTPCEYIKRVIHRVVWSNMHSPDTYYSLLFRGLY